MTTRPYELLARFANDGSVAGVSVRTITSVNGRDYESDPAPLSGATDPAFVAFASAFSASIVAQRDQLIIANSELQSQVTTLTSERDLAREQLVITNDSLAAMTLIRDGLTTDKQTLTEQLATMTSERDALQANAQNRDQRIIELEAQLEALLNPPGPDLTTASGVEQYISQKRYARETAGIVISGQAVSTERDEIGQWLARYAAASRWLAGDPTMRQRTPDGMYPYKPKGGPPTSLSAVQVVRAFDLGQTYINDCFAVELDLYARLDAGEPLRTLVNAVDDPSTWPVNVFSW